MTTEPRRALAALALVPVAAGAFAGSVAWAADRSPTSEPTGTPVAAAPVASVDPQTAAIAEQLDALGARLAAVQAELDARSTQAATVVPAAAPAPRARPAPKAAPPVDTTTRASG